MVILNRDALCHEAPAYFFPVVYIALKAGDSQCETAREYLAQRASSPKKNGTTKSTRQNRTGTGSPSLDSYRKTYLLSSSLPESI